jgi:hypothetical protein
MTAPLPDFYVVKMQYLGGDKEFRMWRVGKLNYNGVHLHDDIVVMRVNGARFKVFTILKCN